MPDEPAHESTRESKLEWLCLAAIITLGAIAVPEWLDRVSRPHLPAHWRQALGGRNWRDICALAYALCLTIPTWRRSGLRPGALREHWKGVLVVVGAPVLVTALVYPQLPVRPFAGAAVGLWLISPAAQDLVFAGFLYGRLEKLFPSYLHPKVRIRWALVITALFFAAWHLPNFGSMHPGYVVFQLAYVIVGSVTTALSRQWTGSVFYCIAGHMACNFIASLPG